MSWGDGEDDDDVDEPEDRTPPEVGSEGGDAAGIDDDDTEPDHPEVECAPEPSALEHGRCRCV